MAANFLQTLNWHSDPELMKHIISFYTKVGSCTRDTPRGWHPSHAQHVPRVSVPRPADLVLARRCTHSMHVQRSAAPGSTSSPAVIPWPPCCPPLCTPIALSYPSCHALSPLNTPFPLLPPVSFPLCSQAAAWDSLASFYEACAQIEVDEYRDYEKALQVGAWEDDAWSTGTAHAARSAVTGHR